MIRRIFIVGCPRSGTTLLQAQLARRAAVTTVPETRFFIVSFRKPGRLARILQGHRALRRLAKRYHLPVSGPSWRLTSAGYVDAFRRTMDELTLRQHNGAWIEKTPDHLFYIDDIARHIPDAQFVHVIRDGRATIASLYELSLERPELYWRRFQSIEHCVERWNAAIRESQRRLGSAAHHFVRYEQLAQQPDNTVESLCRALGVGHSEQAEAETAPERAAAPGFVLAHEVWKAAATQDVFFYGLDKYNRLFDDEQRRRIEEGLVDSTF